MTAPSSLCEPLHGFIDYLRGITDRPDLNELQARLTALHIPPDELTRFANFNEAHYARNLIFETEKVQLLCLCWRSGQRSPIHDHAQSICGVRVVAGIATETRFERVPSGYIKAINSTDYGVDTVMVSQDADTHQIANLQDEGKDLITLHLYSPPLNRMKTYSVESPRSSDYRPPSYEILPDGGGI